MTMPATLALLLVSFLQTPPANPACTLLTPAQVTSLIGAAKATPVSANQMGSTCMLIAGDKVVTVLIVHNTTSDGAARQFESKKLTVSGQPIAGWTLPSYAGGRVPALAAVGFLNALVFTEVRMSDKTQTGDGGLAKLKTVMQEVAARK